MVAFVIGQTVQTKLPQVTVDAGLKPGSHRFRLFVTDDQGNPSRVDEVIVQVRDVVIVQPPPPVLTDPIGPRPPISLPPILTVPVPPIVPVRPPVLTQPVITPVPIAVAPRPTAPLPTQPSTVRPGLVPPRRPRSKKP